LDALQRKTGTAVSTAGLTKVGLAQEGVAIGEKRGFEASPEGVAMTLCVAVKRASLAEDFGGDG
jgi:hypothetical protein